MIQVESDDQGINQKYGHLVEETLSESGIRSIEEVRIVAMMKEGFFIISASLRPLPPPLMLASVGRLEQKASGILLIIDPPSEPLIPLVLTSLKEKFGPDRIVVISRFEIEIESNDIDGVSSIVIKNYEGSTFDNALPILLLLIPEGFRITRIMRNEQAITILSSEHPLQKPWIERMERIHNAKGIDKQSTKD
jgi:putative methanogenesis marker protein 17